MFDRDDTIAQLLAVLAGLGWRPPPAGDAIDQVESGELLDGDAAAFVAGRDSSATLARWAQQAMDEGRPIAIKVGTAWLFVKSRLFDLIERRFGLPARREAQTKHRKLVEMRAGSHKSIPNASARAPTSSDACEIEGNSTAVSRAG